MSNSWKFFFGALVGGVVGSMLAMLFAPTSGSQLRVRINELVLELKDEVTNAASEKRQQLEEELNTLRKA